MKAFINGNIYTLNNFYPKAERMLLSNDGRIIKIGKKGDFNHLVADEIVDLSYKTVIPSFCDSHLHLLNIGEEAAILNLKNKSPEEIIRLIKESLKNKGDGEWIYGRGYDDNRWRNDEKSFDALSTVKNPVFFLRIDGHAGFANSSALKIANISCQTKDPNGGRINRDGRGDPTGILLDNAINLVTDIMPKAVKEDKKRYLKNAEKILIKNGITSICDMGIDFEDAILIRDEIKKGNFRLNYNGYIRYTKNFDYDELNIKKSENFKILGLKVFMDGALGSRGAFLSKPYENEQNYFGLKITDREELLHIFKNLDEKQLSAHAIGDGAISEFLDAYESYFKKEEGISQNGSNFRLEHLQILNEDILERLKNKKIILSIQPSFYQSDKIWAERMIGHNRIKYSYLWESLYNTGCRIICGSDAPIDEINPIIGIYNALTRGNDQNLSLYSAISAYTVNGAIVTENSETFGNLSVGKFGNFVVLSYEIFYEDIANIKDIMVEKCFFKGEQLE